MTKIRFCVVFLCALIVLFSAFGLPAGAWAQAGSKPNIILIVGDNVGWGDLGVYGGGEGRGIPTANLDRLAAEGMTFFSFYGQPSVHRGERLS